MRILALFLCVGCASEEAVKVYNSTPDITITSHSSGEVLQEGYEITLLAQVHDENHSSTELSVVWSSNQRTLCEGQSPSIDGLSQCTIHPEEGETFIRAQVVDVEGAASIAEIAIEIEKTFAPIVQILSPSTQGLYYSDQLILFSAQITDAEDAPEELQYTWESSVDGVLPTTSTATSEGIIEDYIYLSANSHAIKLTVTDLSGKSTEKNMSMLVGGENTRPTCGIISPVTGDTFVMGEPIIFQATAFDEQIDVEDLQIMWLSDKDGELGSGIATSSGEATLTTSSLSADTHTIQFSVRDDMDSACSDSVVISVGTPPELHITSPTSGTSFTYGSVIRFEGTVSDQEELPSQIDLIWSSHRDGVFSTQGSNASGVLDLYVSDLSTGQHTISVTATDSVGLTDSTSFSIFINTAPTAPTVSLGPNPAYTNDSLFAQASGSTDGEGHNITYYYSWFHNNTATSYTGSVLPASATNKGDTWLVRVTPNDGYNDGPYAEASVVISNQTPAISAVVLSATEVSSTDTISCTGSATDADGDALAENYVWTNQNRGISLGTGSNLSLSPLFVSPGESVVCSYSVSDGSLSATTEAVAVVSNTEPVLSSISVVPTEPYLGDVLSCLGSVVDADLETVTESYVWQNQTTGVSLSTSSTFTLTASHASPNDIVACTLTATDASGASVSDTATAIVANSAPTIDSLSFDQTSVALGDTLSCMATASDLEGDLPSFSYSWKNETTGATIGSSSSLLLTSAMATGLDEISCTATATDSYGASDTETISISVNETTPIFSTVATISPSTGVTTSSSLTCIGAAFDPDGTSVSLQYEWIVGSTSFANVQSLALTPTLVQVGDVVRCIITATDGAGEQSTSTATVSIENTPPVVSTVTLSPDPVYTVDSLTASATYSDMDGDALTVQYHWSVNGFELQSGSSPSFSGMFFEKGDTVSVSVVVNDGNTDSTPMTAELVVQNSLATAPSVTLSPTEPSPQEDDLVCTLSLLSADDDGDSISYTFSWTVDGVPYTSATETGTTSTVSAFDTNGGEEWICTITPNDGEEDGISTSESVLITSDVITPGSTEIITRDGFQYQCTLWSGDECLQNWISIPASAFTNEASCGVPDKTSLRPVWHGSTSIQCETICWIATGDSTCVGHRTGGSSGTHTGWMYTSSSVGCDSSGRAYSQVSIPTVGTQVWSFDSMSWSRSGSFTAYRCNW